MCVRGLSFQKLSLITASARGLNSVDWLHAASTPLKAKTATVPFLRGLRSFRCALDP